jgi:hypothetical protein
MDELCVLHCGAQKKSERTMGRAGRVSALGRFAPAFAGSALLRITSRGTRSSMRFLHGIGSVGLRDFFGVGNQSRKTWIAVKRTEQRILLHMLPSQGEQSMIEGLL